MPGFVCRDWREEKGSHCCEAVTAQKGSRTFLDSISLFPETSVGTGVPGAVRAITGWEAENLFGSAMIKSIKMETWKKRFEKRETKSYWFFCHKHRAATNALGPRSEYAQQLTHS